MQPALYRTQVHASDLCDLFIALSFQLPEAENQTMMFWKLLHRFLDDSPQIAFPVEIVRSHPGVFELERSVIIVPTALQLLEKDQGAPRTVPKLVLG